MLMLCTLPAYAGSTSTTAQQAAQARKFSDAEAAAAQGRYADAAGLYESLANELTGSARDRALLKAARNSQKAGAHNKVTPLLSSVSKNLAADDAVLRTVIDAGVEIAANRPQQALAVLDQIPLPLPESQATEVLGERAQAQFNLGRIALAVTTALERESHYKTAADLNQNRLFIWNNLKQAAATGRDLTPPANISRSAAGWLELAAAMNSRQRDPFAFSRALSDWRSRYIGHPGVDFLPVSTPLPITRSNHIALLLPLSGKQQAAGQAVRDGFVAALMQTGTERPALHVYDTNESGALVAYQQATQLGADIIIGPLLREDVDAIAQSNQVGIVTLALNSSSEMQTPNLLFQFTLDPENEARQAAQRAHGDGLKRAIALYPNNDWGQRMHKAFVTQLQAQGDTLVDARSYDPNARDYVNFIKIAFDAKKPEKTKALEQTLGRRQVAETRGDYDYVFIAAQAAQAKQLRPALRFVLPDNSAPVYTTSDSFDAEANDNSDLNDTRFADMPWVVNRDGDSMMLHDGLMKLWGNSMRARSRLFAFGIDAFRISTWLRTNQATFGNTLRGVTGLLALDTRGHIQRQLDWARVANGKPQLLPTIAQ